ncbi:asparagine synthase-related protein [Umezawaea sp.]|uniref:asparagine synthase-related protein n=1 Tax=Umezawaea sp. TaxID=1955258 RepID=UPI002ED0C2DC
MLLTAFGMAGAVRLPSPSATARVTSGPVWDADLSGGSVVWQGPVEESGRPVPAVDRLQLTGWIDVPPSLVRGDESAAVAVRRLLDERGADAVRSLRGDFVLAHLGRDGVPRLYRSVTALIPLFWRADGDRLAWAADPALLLDGGRPTLEDVDADLLPMIIAERGFPHDRSWFAAVRRLPPGRSLTVRAGGPETAEFDALRPVAEPPRSLADAAEGLRSRLADACTRMLAEQRSFVVALSGGIDSAAVAWEAGRQPGRGSAIHYTLESFPGFDADLRAAEEVARACGLSWVPYEMSKHTRHGGDYLQVPDGGGLPQTHVPSHGVTAAVEQAEIDGATFVLSGLLSDQVFAHDVHRGLLEVAGPRLLDPRVAGEPIWQTVANAAAATFSTSSRGGSLRYLRRLASADPTTALPPRDVIVHPIGFTAEAGDRVTRALRDAATLAEERLRSVTSDATRGLPPGLTSLFLLAEGFNTANLQAAWLSHCLPKRKFFSTPYADRDLVEYALALPAAHRLGFGHGMTVDKFAFRLAYANRGLPVRAGTRMQQARIDAISAVFANQNFATCRDLLGPDSLLRRLGVLSHGFADGLTPGRVHRNGEEIARLCVVEKWLRGLS